jgi:hypothetical protein
MTEILHVKRTSFRSLSKDQLRRLPRHRLAVWVARHLTIPATSGTIAKWVREELGIDETSKTVARWLKQAEGMSAAYTTGEKHDGFPVWKPGQPQTFANGRLAQYETGLGVDAMREANEAQAVARYATLSPMQREAVDRAAELMRAWRDAAANGDTQPRGARKEGAPRFPDAPIRAYIERAKGRDDALEARLSAIAFVRSYTMHGERLPFRVTKVQKSLLSPSNRRGVSRVGVGGVRGSCTPCTNGRGVS